MELNKIKSLDGLRAIAIFLVLTWHYFNCLVNGQLFAGAMEQVKYFTFWTWSGVDLFFVLSGFLIGRILLHNRGSKNYFKTFYLRRILRILPAYYLILLIFLIFSLSGMGAYYPWLTAGVHPFYSYCFFIQNFWMAGYASWGSNWLGVTWSLAVEEQFYLLLPLLIYLVNPKYLKGILVFGILSAPFFRAYFQSIGSYVLLPARMDSLFTGVLIAYFHLNGIIEKKLKGKQKFMLLTLAIFFILIFICGNIETLGGVCIHSVLTLFYGTILISVLVLNKNSIVSRVLSSSFLSFFSRISFMIYLSHQVFSGLLHGKILHQTPQINNYKDGLVTLLALVITIAFSGLSYHYYEKPILSLGKKYKYHDKYFYSASMVAPGKI